ncbi:hypothetical protein GEMRC1_012133 [Eukaryota sp. GEM-RC1]
MFEALGSAIGDVDYQKQFFINHLEKKVKPLLFNLKGLPKQVKLLFIRHCINSKLMYFCRTLEPEAIHEDLLLFFNDLVNYIFHLFKIPHSFARRQLLSLPIKLGGMGITNLSVINSVAYHCSLLKCTRNLGDRLQSLLVQKDIDALVLCMTDFYDYLADDYLFEFDLPYNLQFLISNIHWNRIYSDLKDSLSENQLIELEYQLLPFSGSFLLSLPVGDTVFNDVEFNLFVNWRLLNFSKMSVCDLCNYKDLSTAHQLSCGSHSRMVKEKHDELKLFIASFLSVENKNIEKVFLTNEKKKKVC